MKRRLSSDITIKDLLDQNPALLRTFVELRLLCAGCPAEAFHTIENVAKEYGYNPNELLQHFERVIAASSVSGGPKP